jgi:hypothetical protein
MLLGIGGTWLVYSTVRQQHWRQRRYRYSWVDKSQSTCRRHGRRYRRPESHQKGLQYVAVTVGSGRFSDEPTGRRKVGEQHLLGRIPVPVSVLPSRTVERVRLWSLRQILTADCSSTCSRNNVKALSNVGTAWSTAPTRLDS